MATATLLQDRENTSNSATLAVDWVTEANPSALANSFVILRTGSVSSPIEVLLRVASPTDLNTLAPNPLNMLASSAWQYLYAASATPASIRFDTLPPTWNSILNTTVFTDQANYFQANSVSIPDGATLRIYGGYGGFSSGSPLLVPVNSHSMSLAYAINLAPPNYFPAGPSEPATTVSYSIGFASDLPTAYQSVVPNQTTGIISYQNTYNILPTYAPATQITPMFGPVSGRQSTNYFPSCILNIPPPTTVSGTSLLSQTLPPASFSSSVPFLTSTSPFPTNISVWSGYDATGSKLTWNSGVSAITDAVIVRSDNGNSTTFLDSIFYSYYPSANNALSHSIAVQSYIESLLNQESASLLVGGGSLLGVSGYNLTGS